jgi:AN1-like zinc finger protein
VRQPKGTRVRALVIHISGHRTRNLFFIYHVCYLSLSSYLSLNTNTMSSSSSSVPNPNPSRDQQMLAVGSQCSHPSCHLVDFLPFKCQHCANSYCADHFKPASHSCPKYDEAKYNRVAPDCEHCSCTISYRLIQLILLPRPSLQRTCSHSRRRGP